MGGELGDAARSDRGHHRTENTAVIGTAEKLSGACRATIDLDG